MGRSIAEIQADIARTKAEIALRDKYTQGFNQPQTSVGWGSYIVSGDRGMLDQYQNREDAWKKAIEQQQFQATENKANRDNAKEIAAMSKSSGSTSADKLEQFAKFNREREIAEADYEAALANLDPNDDASKANVRKMAAKLNYLYGLQPELGYESVNPDFTKPGKSVEIRNIKSKLKSKLNIKKWTDSDRAEVIELLNRLPEEMQGEFATEIRNHAGTTGDQAREDEETKARYNNMSPSEQRRWKENHPNTAKRLGL